MRHKLWLSPSGCTQDFFRRSESFFLKVTQQCHSQNQRSQTRAVDCTRRTRTCVGLKLYAVVTKSIADMTPFVACETRLHSAISCAHEHARQDANLTCCGVHTFLDIILESIPCLVQPPTPSATPSAREFTKNPSSPVLFSKRLSTFGIVAPDAANWYGLPIVPTMRFMEAMLRMENADMLKRRGVAEASGG